MTSFEPKRPRRIGDLELLRPLGQGGGGTVWEARQPRLGRVVAVKLMHGLDARRPESRDRFRAEAALLARVAHPGIVPILEHGEADGVPYLVLERVEGSDLGQVLERLRREHGPARASLDGATLRRVTAALAGTEATGETTESWSRAVAGIVRDVALALHHAHTCGVLHRDLKPSNVMLTSEGRVLIADFGLARVDDEVEGAPESAASGSLPYLAPECVEGAAGDRRSDVYSLGALLYELVTLERPFQAAEPAALAQKILRGRVARLRPAGRTPRRARDLEAIALRALALDPSQRYASARDLGRDLDAWLEGREPTPRPVGALGRWIESVWRGRVPIAAAGIVAAAILGAPTLVQLQRIATANEVEAAGRLAESHVALALECVQRVLVAAARDSISEQPLSSDRQRELLTTALALTDDLAVHAARHEEAGRPELVRLRMQALLGLAALDREQGESEEAAALIAASLDEVEALTGPSDRTGRALYRAVVHLSRAGAEQRRGDHAAALEAASAGLAAIDGLTTAELVESGWAQLRLNLEQAAASELRMEGRLEEALDHANAAVASARAVVPYLASAAQPGMQAQLGNALNTLGAVHVELGRTAEAKLACQEAMAVLDRADDSATARMARAMAHNNLGLVLQSERNHVARLEQHRAARRLQLELLGLDPGSIGARLQLARTEQWIGATLVAMNGPDEEARRALETSLELARQLVEEVPGAAEHLDVHARAAWSLAIVAERGGDGEEFVRLAAEAHEQSARLQELAGSRSAHRRVHLDICVGVARAEIVYRRSYEAGLLLLLEVVEAPDARGSMLRNVAALRTFAAKLAAGDEGLGAARRLEREEELLTLAVEALDRALDAGYSRRRDLTEAPVFQPLQARADFQEVLARLDR